MKRQQDWEKRLEAAFLAARDKKFHWGTFDCAMFACDCILAMTTVDLGAGYRGKYSSAAEASAIFGPSLAAFVAGVAKQETMFPTPPTFARRGDLVVIDNGTTEKAIAIVDHTGRFARCASETGLKRVHMKHWLRAWRVG